MQVIALVMSVLEVVPATFPWPVGSASRPLADRVPPPEGYRRVDQAEGSFGAWLRGVPVKPGRPSVHLFDGRLKGNQDAHYAVLDVDVGHADLQQCADSVIRLIAEWQWSSTRRSEICFRTTGGDPIPWARWSAGERLVARGRGVAWVGTRERARGDYDLFRGYLDVVFTYAGTLSLARDLAPVDDVRHIAPGDVFVHGGSPGHAVLVLDVAERPGAAPMFLLAQGYMPAQEMQVLANPGSQDPWYAVGSGDELVTPEWTFRWTDLHRLGPNACP